MSKEEISLTASKNKEKYDEVVKQNMHHPKLIAPILKTIVPEYKNCSCSEIVELIVKDSISEDPIDDVSVVAGMETEMSSISEKLIRYDSRFRVKNPILSKGEIKVYLHIDLEVQNNYNPSNPSYPIVKRGIYYGARELSSQLGILTETTNYNNLEKVYSIWICNENIPKELQNTVTSYKISKTDEIGITDEDDSNYDLMTVIIVRRGDENGDATIFDYLTSFFKSDIEGICKYVDIKDDKEIMEGVKKMSGLGQAIANKAVVDELIRLVQKGLLALKDAAAEADMSETEFSKLLTEKKN